MKWLLDRWQLKLIALSLAVALYFFTGTQITDTANFTIKINEGHVSLPKGWIASSVQPREMDVRIRGPKSLLDDLSAEDVVPHLRVSDAALDERRQVFDVTSRLLSLSGGLILDNQPQPIRVEFSRRVERSLPFDDRPEVIGVPAGMKYSLEFDLTHVRVVGPEDVVADLEAAGKIPIYPIELGDVDPDAVQRREFRLPVIFKPGTTSVTIANRGQVNVKVTVEPERQELSTPPLPVGLLLSADKQRQYDIRLSPEVVVFKVSGPVNRLAKLKPTEQIRAFVDVSDPEELQVPYEQAVEVVAPVWLSVKSQTVTVTVSLRQDERQPPPGEDEGGEATGVDRSPPPPPETP